MFRFINKNLMVGSVEMATVGRDVAIEQPVPYDVYHGEPHHLLALGGSMSMRSSLKHETWDGRGSHLRMYVDFFDVSLLALSLSLMRNDRFALAKRVDSPLVRLVR